MDDFLGCLLWHGAHIEDRPRRDSAGEDKRYSASRLMHGLPGDHITPSYTHFKHDSLHSLPIVSQFGCDKARIANTYFPRMPPVHDTREYSVQDTDFLPDASELEPYYGYHDLPEMVNAFSIPMQQLDSLKTTSAKERKAKILDMSFRSEGKNQQGARKVYVLQEVKVDECGKTPCFCTDICLELITMDGCVPRTDVILNFRKHPVMGWDKKKGCCCNPICLSKVWSVENRSHRIEQLNDRRSIEFVGFTDVRSYYQREVKKKNWESMTEGESGESRYEFEGCVGSDTIYVLLNGEVWWWSSSTFDAWDPVLVGTFVDHGVPALLSADDNCEHLYSRKIVYDAIIADSVVTVLISEPEEEEEGTMYESKYHTLVTKYPLKLAKQCNKYAPQIVPDSLDWVREHMRGKDKRHLDRPEDSLRNAQWDALIGTKTKRPPILQSIEYVGRTRAWLRLQKSSDPTIVGDILNWRGVGDPAFPPEDRPDDDFIHIHRPSKKKHRGEPRSRRTIGDIHILHWTAIAWGAKFILCDILQGSNLNARLQLDFPEAIEKFAMDKGSGVLIFRLVNGNFYISRLGLSPAADGDWKKTDDFFLTSPLQINMFNSENTEIGPVNFFFSPNLIRAPVLTLLSVDNQSGEVEVTYFPLLLSIILDTVKLACGPILLASKNMGLDNMKVAFESQFNGGSIAYFTELGFCFASTPAMNCWQNYTTEAFTQEVPVDLQLSQFVEGTFQGFQFPEGPSMNQSGYQMNYDRYNRRTRDIRRREWDEAIPSWAEGMPDVWNRPVENYWILGPLGRVSKLHYQNWQSVGKGEALKVAPDATIPPYVVRRRHLDRGSPNCSSPSSTTRHCSSPNWGPQKAVETRQ